MNYQQPRTLQELRRREPEHKTVKEVLTALRQWEEIHNPTDRGGILNQFQFVVMDTPVINAPVKKEAALVPFSSAMATTPGEPLILMPHAQDQLFSRLRYPRDLYDRLPSKLNVLNLNTLIQNEEKDRDVCIRLQDKTQARAIVSGRYEPFDNLDYIEMLAPFTEDALVRWEFNDGLTFHLSITFPQTRTELRVGDVVEQGIHISNSEVALRSIWISAYVLKLKCMNGLIGSANDGGFFRIRHI